VLEVTRDIPEAVKRQLRREAGFGCCICGHPFFEYHHILPFSPTPHHNAKDMMILCPNHHHQATVNALDEDTQRKAKRQPFNILRGYANGQLMVNDKFVAVEVGSNYLVGPGFKFLIDDESLLQIRLSYEGRLLVSLSLYDEEDQLLFCVADNEWITGDPQPWDFEFAYNILKLRRRTGSITLDVDARKTPLKILGEFWRKQQKISIRKDGLIFNGIVKNAGMFNLGLVGMQLTVDIAKSSASWSRDPRLKNGLIVSWPNPIERLDRSIQAYKKLLKETGIGRNDPCLCGNGKKFKRCCGV
jgi:SEC-C motif